MNIHGVVENIVYRNDENGYTVAKFSCDNKMYTIVGKLLQVNVGDNLRLEGEFVSNSRYGSQFAFEGVEYVYPTTLAGIEKYLGSGLIKGVGPVTAKAIVSKFKEDTLAIIEFNPLKLEQIRGISKNKAQSIGDSFRELKKFQATIIFLQTYNISINMALKIYEVYKDKTTDIVKNNPYKLVEDIDGIGFLTADVIAKKIGIDPKSKYRIRAGLMHCLKDNSEKTGNTFIYKKELFLQAEKILGFEEDECLDIFSAVMDEMKIESQILVFFENRHEIVMLSRYYYLESSVAQKLCLLKYMSVSQNYDVESDIVFFEKVNSIKLHSEQKNAVKTAINSGVSLITGGPGTGKTTIIKCIINIFNQLGKKVILLAPTGRAAKRLNESTGVEARTIHRALEIDFKSKGNFVYNETNPLECDAVIVDEVSMVDISLMNSLLKALPRDCNLTLVGDKDQLPSVGAGNVLDDILTSGVFEVSMLTKIFRQEDSGLIITNAHLINSGKMPIVDNKSKDFFFEQKQENNEICESIMELITHRIPNYLNIDSSKIQILAPLKAGICGTNSLNQKIQKNLNPPSLNKNELVMGASIFREGDKVMHVANNYNLSWKKKNGFLIEEGQGVFNGDIGYIYKIDRQTGETTVWFEDGREAIYTKDVLSELTLAYAITIHKSQGSEFDVVVVPVIAGPPMILTRNLIYTAVTRAKSMVVLVGEKKHLSRMIRNDYTIKRLTLLKTLILDKKPKIEEMFKID